MSKKNCTLTDLSWRQWNIWGLLFPVIFNCLLIKWIFLQAVQLVLCTSTLLPSGCVTMILQRRRFLWLICLHTTGVYCQQYFAIYYRMLLNAAHNILPIILFCFVNSLVFISIKPSIKLFYITSVWFEKYCRIL